MAGAVPSGLNCDLRGDLCLLKFVRQLPAQLPVFTRDTGQQMKILNALALLRGVYRSAQDRVADLSAGKFGNGGEQIQLP